MSQQILNYMVRIPIASNVSIVDSYLTKNIDTVYFQFMRHHGNLDITEPNSALFKIYESQSVTPGTSYLNYYVCSDVSSASVSLVDVMTISQVESIPMTFIGFEEAADITGIVSFNIKNAINNNYAEHISRELNFTNYSVIKLQDYYGTFANNFIDDSTSYIIKSTSISPAKRFDTRTGSYPPYVETPFNSSVVDRLSTVNTPVKKLLIKDSSGNGKRLFLQFNLASINGESIFGFVKANITSVSNDKKILPIKIYTTDDTSWSTSSSISSLDTIFNTSTYHEERRMNSILDSTNQLLFDIRGFGAGLLNSEGVETKGTRWFYDNSKTLITVILDVPDITGASSTIDSTSTNFSLGNILNGTNKNISNNPSLLVGYNTPKIGLDTTSISKTITAGQALPDEIINITNIGKGALTATNTATTVSWIQSCLPNPPSDLTSLQSATATLVFDTTGLSVGSYYGSFLIKDLDAEPIQKQINLNLTVVSGSFLEVTDTTFSHTVYKGGSIPDDTFQVYDGNPAEGDNISYTMTDNAFWILLSDSTGVSISPSDKQTHTITYNIDSLSAGIYTGLITITRSNGTGPLTKTITINLIIKRKKQSSGTYSNFII